MATVCHRMSLTFTSTRGGWVTLGRKGLTSVSLDNFIAIWERHRGFLRKRIPIDIFCRLNTMHVRDRQTDHGTVTLWPVPSCSYQTDMLASLFYICIYVIIIVCFKINFGRNCSLFVISFVKPHITTVTFCWPKSDEN